MKVLWKNGTVFSEGNMICADVLSENGIIKRIEEGITENADQVYQLDGKYLVPGFFDIHTHGAVHIDVNGAKAEDFETICRFLASKGTTGWLCSILTDTKEQTMSCIEEYNRWKKLEHKGAKLWGIHLEGPFLSAEYKGAMPEHLLLKPDFLLLMEYQNAAGGDIRYITVSPEVEGMVDMIPKIKDLGIQVAIGHSGADYETAIAAIERGARSATHTGNAMKLLHQHYPAIFGAVLEDDRVCCEVICDGRHLHPGTVRLILKTKGLNRVVAITDAIMAAGLLDGDYKLGVNDVVVKDGDAKLKVGGNRAGSTLTMDTALRNLMGFTGKGLNELLPVMTKNPASLIGIYDRTGSISVGKQADLTVLDKDIQVKAAFSEGREVFLAADWE